MNSMAMLHLVLSSKPTLQFLGVDIFDRRYPGLEIFEGVKHCLKVLLTRGARLGKYGCAPASKLLRKVEADFLFAWVQTYFGSMVAAGMDVPDHVQTRIEAFFFPDSRYTHYRREVC